MKDRKEIVKILYCEGVLLISWVVYFMKFKDFYKNTELFISDEKPLIDQLLIFVTYSKEKSFVFFCGGLCLIFLLMWVAAKCYSFARQTDLEKKASYFLWVLAIINLILILMLCQPIVYPIFIAFSLFSGTSLYIRSTFNKLRGMDEQNYTDGYEDDYEESYEGSDETKTTR